MNNRKKLWTIALIGVMSATVAVAAACTPHEDHKHTLDKVDAKEATCTQAGNEQYWFCDGCDKYFSDADATKETTLDKVTIPAGHKLQKTEERGATCTEAGNSAYWQCSVCEKYFSDADAAHETTLDAVTVAAGHKLQKTEAKEATCTEDGNEQYWQCSVCEKYFSDEDGNEPTTLEDVTIAAHHEIVKKDAVPAWKEDGCTAHWECTECEKCFSDENGETIIDREETVIHAVAAPEAAEGDDVYVGNAKATKDFFTPANWVTFSTENCASYENGSAVPTVDETGGTHLVFTKAARFELFHVPGVNSTWTHLGETSQTTGGSQWGNAGNFSGLYDNDFRYTFDLTSTGPFAFEVFGLSGSKADGSGQGTRLVFEKNVILFYGGSSNGNNNQTLRAVATLPENFDIGDGEHHTVLLSIKRGAPDDTTTTVTEYKIYIDGFMVRFENKVESSWNVADENGVLHINIGKDSGMGQRLSVIPHINSEEGAAAETYSTVCIYGLKIKRVAPASASSIAAMPCLLPEGKYDF